MTRIPTAYLPVATYPDVASDDAILAAIRFVGALGRAVHVTTFAVEIPQIVSPLGGLFLNVPAMVRAAEEKSRTECARLLGLLERDAGVETGLEIRSRTVALGTELDMAAAEARLYDLSVLPWGGATASAMDLAQAVLFGSGRPALLVPSVARIAPLDHIAVAWDGSRVAARALWDALALLPESGRVTVLTVGDEKPLAGPDLATSLAASLQKRGYGATSVELALENRSIAGALQDSALETGAQLLVMGAFGHSRLRDFILGGATKGVMTDARLPILLSH